MTNLIVTDQDWENYSEEEMNAYLIEFAEYQEKSWAANAASYISTNCCNHASINRQWYIDMAVDDYSYEEYIRDLLRGTPRTSVDDSYSYTYSSAGHILYNANPTCPAYEGYEDACFNNDIDPQPHIV